MAIPAFYYANMLARGAISGSNPDLAFPVRRLADSDTANPYPLTSGVLLGGPLSGTVRVVLASGDLRTHFAAVRGEGLSGVQVEVWSEDADGSNAAQHLDATLSGDVPAVFALSGVSGGTPRRAWRLEFRGLASGDPVPELNEGGLFKRVEFPARPDRGVGLALLHQATRLPIPGGAAFRFRLGDEIERHEFSVLATSSQWSGFKAFLRENDGGQPVIYEAPDGRLLWAELPETRFDFADDAGLETLRMAVLEVPEE